MDFDPQFTPRPKRLDSAYGGLLAFAAAMLVLWFVAAPIQTALGMTGLATTEVMLLAVGLLFGRLSGQPMKEIFPLTRPTGRQMLATLVLWAGYLGLAMSVTLAVAFYFPQEIFGVSRQIGELLGGWPLPATILVSALMPALCEEGLCRGFIQHSFRRMNPWAEMLAVAVLFGLLHFSPYRFLPTAILGFALAYLRRRTGSLILPMVLHFVNNTFSAISGALSGPLAEAGGVNLDTIGLDILGMVPALVCHYALAAPAAIYLGSRLLQPPRPLGERRDWRGQRGPIFTVVVLTLLLLAGFIAGIASHMDDFAQVGQELLSLIVILPSATKGCF